VESGFSNAGHGQAILSSHITSQPTALSVPRLCSASVFRVISQPAAE